MIIIFLIFYYLIMTTVNIICLVCIIIMMAVLLLKYVKNILQIMLNLNVNQVNCHPFLKYSPHTIYQTANMFSIVIWDALQTFEWTKNRTGLYFEFTWLVYTYDITLLSKFTFQALKVVYRYRDPQPQVLENYTYLVNLRPNIYNYWCTNANYIPNISDLISE